VVGNKTTQNAEVMLDLNPNQSQCEKDCQDQEDDAFTKVQNKTSNYNGIYWYRDRKKWGVEIKHNKQRYYGGYFENEEHAAMKVNLLCDKYEIERKNPTIEIEPDAMHQSSVKSQTSKYNGVSWNNKYKKWQINVMHNKKQYFGGYFDEEEHAAMKVNLLCDKYEKERKNPMVTIKPDAIEKVPNKTSIYDGVSWNKDKNKWRAQVTHNKKRYFGGYFDHEKHAAMKVNLLCDKYEMDRKNPMINIRLHTIQQIPNKTSVYTGVCWNKNDKKWRAQFWHNNKNYHGGYFNNEEHAAMKINLLCDKIEIERKNPEINKDVIQKKAKSKLYQYTTENVVNKEVKIEGENILDRFKDECEDRFIHQSNDEERCIAAATEFQNSNAKRKQKQNLIFNDDVKEEKVEIETPTYDENDLDYQYTKKHD